MHIARFFLTVCFLCLSCAGDDGTGLDSNGDSDADDDDDNNDDNNDNDDNDDDNNDDDNDDNDDDNDDSGGDSDSDSDSDITICIQSCDDASDCVPTSSTAITDTDNYECEGGYCRYKGCNGDEECQEVYMSSDYGCNEYSSYGAPTCTQLCDTVSDCDLESVMYDEDNYDCDDGYCDYAGCNSDSECREGMMDEDYVCAEIAGMEIDMCVLSCDSPADCVIGSGPAYDSDNYDCIDDVCVYSGCNSTEECEETSNMGSGWECV